MIVAGIHLPDGDTHFAEQIAANPLYRGKGTYQWAKLTRALEVCGPRRGHAVDVGAHVGLWSRVLSYEFKRVTAFEPTPLFTECFRRNLGRRPGVTLREIALGEVVGASWIVPDGSGSAHLAGQGDIEVQVARLDEWALSEVDFVKIDCEGAELPALRGGEETIRRDKPVVLVEQKPKRTAAQGHPRAGAVDLLLSWGAELVAAMKGDFLLRWPA